MDVRLKRYHYIRKGIKISLQWPNEGSLHLMQFEHIQYYSYHIGRIIIVEFYQHFQHENSEIASIQRFGKNCLSHLWTH